MLITCSFLETKCHNLEQEIRELKSGEKDYLVDRESVSNHKSSALESEKAVFQNILECQRILSTFLMLLVLLKKNEIITRQNGKAIIQILVEIKNKTCALFITHRLT